MAKSMKVGLDTTEVKSKLLKNQRELNDLLEMYNEVETATMCQGDLVKKCSDTHIKELEINITTLEKRLLSLEEQKLANKVFIEEAKKAIDDINE
jgi:hypothetical protein